MRGLTWLLACTALAALAAGCGDDTTGGGTDAGPPPTDSGQNMMDSGPAMVTCPDTAPNVDQMMGPCCYLASNADHSDSPTFRISGLKITTPSSLSSAIIQGAIQGDLDAELFNWLVRITNAGADGTVMIETGYGQLNASDNSFSFCETGVGAPCDPTRWGPVNWTGTLSGENITTDPAPSTVTLPIFDSTDPTMVILELPLYSLQIDTATMSEMRSCIGSRMGHRFDTGQASITTYITVADAMAGHVKIGTTIDTSLCMMVAGMPTATGDCTTNPQTMWNVKPDSMCDTGTGTCTWDPGDGSVCDPATTCNAWQIMGELSAQGVTIN